MSGTGQVDLDLLKSPEDSIVSNTHNDVTLSYENQPIVDSRSTDINNSAEIISIKELDTPRKNESNQENLLEDDSPPNENKCPEVNHVSKDESTSTDPSQITNESEHIESTIKVESVQHPNKSGQTFKKFTALKNKEQERNLQQLRLQKSRYCFTETVLRSKAGRVQAVGHYVVTEELGRGAFGCVYKVEHRQDADSVNIYAMKMFLDQGKSRKASGARMYTGDDPKDTILKEAAFMKALHHPHLIRLIEIVEEKNSPFSLFVVMEFASAGPIMRLKKGVLNSVPLFFTEFTEDGLFGEAMASRLFREILSGMAYLHLNRIAHRDLKPDNIMLTDKLSVKIVDFGVSREFNGESRRGGLVSDTQGTWAFWSPEMCDDSGDVSRYSSYAADVWAAGIILWVMVFGSLPFYGDSPDDIFDKILLPLPEFPRRRSPEFEVLLRAMLDRDVDSRPSFSACEAFDWIQQHSNPEVETEIKGAYTEIDVTSLEKQGAISFFSAVQLSTVFKERLTSKVAEVRNRLKRRSLEYAKKKLEEETKRRSAYLGDEAAGDDASSIASSMSSVEPGPPTDNSAKRPISLGQVFLARLMSFESDSNFVPEPEVVSLGGLKPVEPSPKKRPISVAIPRPIGVGGGNAPGGSGCRCAVS